MEKEEVMIDGISIRTAIIALVHVVDKHSKMLKKMNERMKQLERQIPEREARKDNDLDSIEYDASSKNGRVKIYFDSRRTEEERKEQIDTTIEMLKYLKKKMEKEE